MISVPFVVEVATLFAVMAATRPFTIWTMSLLLILMRMLPGSAGTAMSSGIPVLLASMRGHLAP